MDLHLGATLDDGGEHGDPLVYESSDLTTHGVIVGMTGSGKTGLGVIFLEEVLRNGIPALVLDPKGDMTNLVLTFPDLDPASFAPWLDPSERGDAESVEDAAARVAGAWASGLAGWGMGGADIAALRERAGFTIYTPGSTTGVPIDVVGRLAPPALSWDEDAETLRSEIQGLASGLLGLIDVDADPLTSRQHILLCNLVEHAWRAGTTLDMATILSWIQRPPMRKLGVFDVEAFYPESDRRELALKLNGLLASPAFAAWTQGQPIDIEAMLWREGRPQAAIVYLAHLSDPERQFVVALVLSKLVTWMRSQPGSAELRVLAYMDEVVGFAPPTAAPPAKQPILTILKQGRAFGVGMLLATQNPVDLDYKAMSNAGTWAIGRLQTARDKERVLEGLRSASGGVDVASLDVAISGLAKRSFLLHDVHRPPPTVFTTRWAMSYLRGPMTGDEIRRLGQEAAEAGAPAVSVAAAAPAMPPIAAGAVVGHLDPAAPWAAAVGADPAGDHYEAALSFRVTARYDDVRAAIDHTVEWEAVAATATHPVATAGLVRVDHDRRDRLEEPPRPAPYVLPPAPIDDSDYFTAAAAAVAAHVRDTATLQVAKNSALGLYSRPGEPADLFGERCRAAADERADEAAAKLSKRYEQRIDTLRRRLAADVAKAETAAERLRAEQQDRFLDQAGAVFDLLAGRGSVGKLTKAGRGGRGLEDRLRSTEDRIEATSAEIADLESELEAELVAIATEAAAAAAEVEEVEVGLERDDITVTEVALLWVLRGEP